MLDKLGFVIHPDKSAFLPKQIIVFLGFTINSVDMTVTLTDETILKIKTLILQVLNSEKVTIREVARVIGYFISSLPAVGYGALYYRALEKTRSLDQNENIIFVQCNLNSIILVFKITVKIKVKFIVSYRISSWHSLKQFRTWSDHIPNFSPFYNIPEKE